MWTFKIIWVPSKQLHGFKFFVYSFQMAYELHSLLIDAVSMMTGEKVMPAYGGESESFLNNIVFPVYKVIQEVLNFQNIM